MTQHRFEPRALLTVMEAARQLHVSDDTVRRQIRAGDLEAVQIGTTPTGRPRYRIPALAIAERLKQSTDANPAGTSSAASAAGRLQAAFEQLTPQQQEALLAQAIAWARETRPAPTAARQPALSAAELEERVSSKGRLLMALQD